MDSNMLNDIVTTGGVVAGPHPQAAKAGLDVLKRGGNAVDAAVAALITLSVVVPDNVGIGGYGGCMVIYNADEKRVVAIDFDSRAPFEFQPGLYSGNPEAAIHGYLSVSVPGVVAGLALALETCGTMAWKDVSGYAVELAEDGFILNSRLASTLKTLAEYADSASYKAIFPDGVVPGEGELFVQKDMERLIRCLGDEGPRSFYEGEIPKQIVRQVRDNGGILSEADFNQYSAKIVEPISVNHNGYQIYAPPVPSGSLTALQTLNIMECLNVQNLEPWSAEYYHLMAESIKIGWEDRRRYFGDPDFVDVPVDMLLSGKHAKECAARISKSGVSSPQMAGATPGHTVHVVAADEKRNLVSLTATQGELFGSRVVIDGLGLVLGHGMSRFDQDPASPNYPAPGKRMQHNMCPVIITKDDKPYCAVGLPGGPRIVSVTPQLIIDLLDFKTSVSEAIAAPRIYTDGIIPLTVQPSIGDDVIRTLEDMGHKINLVPGIAGPASGFVVDSNSGTISAASENGSECVGTSE